MVLTAAWCTTTTSTTSFELCATKYGPSPVPDLPRTTLSTTVRFTQTNVATVTPTTTIEPAPKTVYGISVVLATKTVTLLNTKISTLTSTETFQPTVAVTNTVTITVVDPSTVGVTITGSATTTTVPTSPGFVPASSAPRLRKREPSARANVLAGKRPNLLPRSDSKGDPISVTCGVLVKIIVTETKTVIAAKTVTVTGLQSTTSKIYPITVGTVTKTICPAGASTTLHRFHRADDSKHPLTLSLLVNFKTTVTTTLAPTTVAVPTTTTLTTTATLTVTVPGPEETLYAACAPDNLLTNNPNEGGNIIRVKPYLLDFFLDSTAESAYDCCAQCIQRPYDLNCNGGVYYMDGSGRCVLPVQYSNPEECIASSDAVAVRGSPDAEVPLFTAFGGPCGNVFGSRFDSGFDDPGAIDFD
ncbi:MAG: hypothetical protein Q9204_004633, partial [Flavoplaca sp. TL-2023a]